MDVDTRGYSFESCMLPCEEDGGMKKDLPGTMGKEENLVRISEEGGGTRPLRRRDRSGASDAVEGQVT